MARLMSVSLTEDAVRSRRKTVTRRLGWRMLKPGDHLQLCRKVMGRKPGEPLERIAMVEVVSARQERLDAVTPEDVRREGFDLRTDPHPADAQWFVDFFTAHMKCRPDTLVTRIEWRYLTEDAPELAGRSVPAECEPS